MQMLSCAIGGGGKEISVPACYTVRMKCMNSNFSVLCFLIRPKQNRKGCAVST